jgi:hypothetical protein
VLIAATVADHPVSFAELENVLNISDDRLMSALVELQTMFLFPKPRLVEGEQRFGINSNTRRLVQLIEGSSDAYARIEAKSKALAGKLPDVGRGIVAAMIRQAWLLKNSGRFQEAETLLLNATERYGVTYSKEDGWSFTDEAEKVKEVFRLFLSGETSYTGISRRLNLPRTDVQFMLKNPIYSGWRIYDEKRDPSAWGYRARPGGRQGDRRKIKRSPEEIIRVHVLDGLVSEEDFARVQQMIELKRQKHWRGRNDASHRYTYNGFLTCGDADCDGLVYTHTSKNDFYVCKSHHPRERRKRAQLGLAPCTNRHMLRKKLEPKIDYLLGRKLVEPEFLGRLIEEYNDKTQARKSVPSVDERNVRARLSALAEKRERILETFFEGMIGKEERDRRVGETEREITTYQSLLMDCACAQPKVHLLDADAIQAVIEPFAEWEFLQREDKRRLLGLLCPEIAVYRYQIKALTLNLGGSTIGGDENSRRRTAPSPSRAPPCP